MKFGAIAIALMIVVLTACENTLLDHEHPIPEHSHPDLSGLLYNERQLGQFSNMMRTIVADVADGEGRRYFNRVVTIRAIMEDLIEPDRFSNNNMPFIDLKTNNQEVKFIIVVSNNLPEASKIYRKGTTYTFTVLITDIVSRTDVDREVFYGIRSVMLGDAYGFDRN